VDDADVVDVPESAVVLVVVEVDDVVEVLVDDEVVVVGLTGWRLVFANVSRMASQRAAPRTGPPQTCCGMPPGGGRWSTGDELVAALPGAVAPASTSAAARAAVAVTARRRKAGALVPGPRMNESSFTTAGRTPLRVYRSHVAGAVGANRAISATPTVTRPRARTTLS
jgi:hypothetical protein